MIQLVIIFYTNREGMHEQYINHSQFMLSPNKKKGSSTKKNKKLFKMHTLKSLGKNKEYVKDEKSLLSISLAEQDKYKCKEREHLRMLEKEEQREQRRNNLIDLQSIDIVKYVQQKYKLSSNQKNNESPSSFPHSPNFLTQISELNGISEQCLSEQTEQPFTRYNSLQTKQIKINNLPALYSNAERFAKTEAIQLLPFNFHKQTPQKDIHNNKKSMFLKTQTRMQIIKSPEKYQPCHPKLYNDFIFENYSERKNIDDEKHSEKKGKLFRLTANANQSEYDSSSLCKDFYQSMYSTGFKQRRPYLINHNLDHFRRKMAERNQNSWDKQRNGRHDDKVGQKLTINCSKFEHISFENEKQENTNTNEDSGLKKFIKLLSTSKKTSRTMKAQIGKNSIYHIKVRKNNHELLVQNSKQIAEIRKHQDETDGNFITN